MASKSLELGDEDKPQKWRSHWLAFCGTCSPIDCISCCTAHFAPCVAYGWTTSRVFRTSFWGEMCKCFCLIFGLVFCVSFLFELAKVATCAPPAGQDPTDLPVKPSFSCRIMSETLDKLLFWFAISCGVVWAVYVGGRRRTQLRKLLGIADTGAGGDCCISCFRSPDRGSGSDCCLHFWCMSCGLAQEMRTVWHLKAANRLPEVPPEGYEPLLTKAPALSGSMTRVAPVATMV